MVNKHNSQWNPEKAWVGARIAWLIDATNNLVKWYLWYWERWISTQNSEWRNIKILFDTTTASLEKLAQTISAYDTITITAPISEKRSLSGEIGLLQSGITLIYGESDHKTSNENSLHGNLREIAPVLWRVDTIILLADQWVLLWEKIEDLKWLESLVMMGDKHAESQFLALSTEIRWTLWSYYTITYKALKNIKWRKIV